MFFKLTSFSFILHSQDFPPAGEGQDYPTAGEDEQRVSVRCSPVHLHASRGSARGEWETNLKIAHMITGVLKCIFLIASFY